MNSSRLGISCAFVAVLTSACGRASFEAKSTTPSPAVGIAVPPSVSAQEAAPAASPPSPEPVSAPTAVSNTGSGLAVAPGAPSAAAPVGAQAATEMLDIEAHLALLVGSVSDARERLRGAALARGATITSDVVQDDGSPRQVSLTIRVPVGKSREFLDEVERVGEVTSRQITAQDIGREYHDSEIVLHNLERTLARYEEILLKAQSVEEILRIEAELSRIRGEIDRVKGSLRYLGDRAARATVYVVIHERTKEVAEAPAKEVKFYPGLRAIALTELRGEKSSLTTFGGAVAVGAGRGGNFELDALKQSGTGSTALDVVMLTLGGDAYSDFLGGGERTFLNPYLGLRAGYARVRGTNNVVLGTTLGVELWKTRYATIDADLRVLGLFGKIGSELGLQPTLGANVAF